MGAKGEGQRSAEGKQRSAEGKQRRTRERWRRKGEEDYDEAGYPNNSYLWRTENKQERRKTTKGFRIRDIVKNWRYDSGSNREIQGAEL